MCFNFNFPFFSFYLQATSADDDPAYLTVDAMQALSSTGGVQGVDHAALQDWLRAASTAGADGGAGAGAGGDDDQAYLTVQAMQALGGGGGAAGVGNDDPAYLTVRTMQSLSANGGGGGGGGGGESWMGAGPLPALPIDVAAVAGMGGGGGGGAGPPPLPSTDRLKSVVAAARKASSSSLPAVATSELPKGSGAAYWEWEDNPVGSDSWCAFHPIVAAKLEQEFL